MGNDLCNQVQATPRAVHLEPVIDQQQTDSQQPASKSQQKEQQRQKDQFLQRQRQYQRKKEAKIASQQQTKENLENKECTFYPKTRPKARRSQQVPSREELSMRRLLQLEAKKCEQAQELKKQIKSKPTISEESRRISRQRRKSSRVRCSRAEPKQPKQHKLSPLKAEVLVNRLSSPKKTSPGQKMRQVVGLSPKSKKYLRQMIDSEVDQCVARVCEGERISYLQFCQVISEMQFVHSQSFGRDRSLLNEAWHLVQRDGFCDVEAIKRLVGSIMGSQTKKAEQKEEASALKLRESIDLFSSRRDQTELITKSPKCEFRQFYINRLNSDLSKSSISQKREESNIEIEELQAKSPRRDRLALQHQKRVEEEAGKYGIPVNRDTMLKLKEYKMSVRREQQTEKQLQECRPRARTTSRHRAKVLDNETESTACKNSGYLFELKIERDRVEQVRLLEGERADEFVQRVTREHGLTPERATKLRNYLGAIGL